jgi:hypothetical protein
MGETMALKRIEKERITDSIMKLRSVSSTLKGINREEIPALEGVEDCLEDADKVLLAALRSPTSDDA